MIDCIVCVDVLSPSQQFISHVGTISYLPGLNKYLASDKVCVRVLDSRPKGSGFEPHRRH